MRRSDFDGRAKGAGRQKRRERRSILPSGFIYDQDESANSVLKIKRSSDGETFVLLTEAQLATLQN